MQDFVWKFLCAIYIHFHSFMLFCIETCAMASVCHRPQGVSQVEVVCLVSPGALNDIRFAAYRTGMKLRMLQKKLGCELGFFLLDGSTMPHSLEQSLIKVSLDSVPVQHCHTAWTVFEWLTVCHFIV